MLVPAGGAVFTNQMKHSSILYLRKALLALSHFISSAKSFNAQSMPTKIGQFSGRVCINSFPTGIEVCDSVHHGGPYPATTDAQHTSIGTAGISRWGRPISFQGTPDELLPDELKSDNPLGLMRLVDGTWTRDAVS